MDLVEEGFEFGVVGVGIAFGTLGRGAQLTGGFGFELLAGQG